MVHGVVMGNRSLKVEYHNYPRDLFHYCVGLDSSMMLKEGRTPETLAERVEENLKQEHCCGVKLYPGYNRIWLSDPVYDPVYELARKYDKPVAVHMGLTAHPRAYLKYSHPLALDEAAADHRKTRFVMCHFGNPFLDAAVAVMEKNRNVSADLSGLLEGRLDLDAAVAMDPVNRVRGSGILKFLAPQTSLSLYDYAVLMMIVSDNSATNHIINSIYITSC
jgi:hypothetical protein